MRLVARRNHRVAHKSDSCLGRSRCLTTSRVGLKDVDYFVFGIGFGASLVLAGWALRQYGPGLRFRQADSGKNVLSAEEMLVRHDWARFCISLGGLLSIAGGLLLASTVVTLLIRPSDRTGAIVAIVLFGLVLLGVAIWIGIFLSQHQKLGFRRAASSHVLSSATRSNDADQYVDADPRDGDEPRVDSSGEQIAAQDPTPASSMSLRHRQNRRRVVSVERPLPSRDDVEFENEPPNDFEQTSKRRPARQRNSSLGNVRFARPPRARNTSDQRLTENGIEESEDHDPETEAESLFLDSPGPEDAHERSGSDERDAFASPQPAHPSGDDVVSSVTVQETSPETSPTADDDIQEPFSSSDEGEAKDQDEPISSTDARGQRDTAVANLKMRRGSRSQIQRKEDGDYLSD
jgi:hypothetical protein